MRIQSRSQRKRFTSQTCFFKKAFNLRISNRTFPFIQQFNLAGNDIKGYDIMVLRKEHCNR